MKLLSNAGAEGIYRGTEIKSSTIWPAPFTLVKQAEDFKLAIAQALQRTLFWNFVLPAH